MLKEELNEIGLGIPHPGFMEKVSGFLVSFKDWFAAGMPWRSPEETKELFETHCLGIIGRDSGGAIYAKPCPEYDPERRAFIGWPKGTCNACGCHVGPDAFEVLNKVNKPHIGCPLKKWLRVIDIKEDDDD